MDDTWRSFREIKRTTFVDLCVQLTVALAGLMQQWGDSCLLLDEDGEMVSWPIVMM